jgi:hypothetical protein
LGAGPMNPVELKQRLSDDPSPNTTLPSSIGFGDFDIKTLSAAALAFAFSFNVGHFYVIEINLFTQFTVSEHIVFAIKALPVALAILILFEVVLFIVGLSHLNLRFKKPLLY